MHHLISPSLLSADFSNLQRDVEMLNESDADWFHLDIMDGRFVPNITFGPPVVKSIKKHAKKPLDVHLMIVEPARWIDAFADAGADMLTLHYEADNHIHRSIQAIKGRNMLAGVSLNPHTPVELLSDLITDLDLVLIMSVNPGFGGQKFIPQTLDKVRRLKAMIERTGASTRIEIDGGVNFENAPLLVDAGANILVAGNTVFGAKDPKEAIKKLKCLS